MMASVTRKLKVYNIKISDLSVKFTLNWKVRKVKQSTLLSLPNPNHKEITEQ